MSSPDLRISLGGGAGRLAIARDLREHVRLAQDEVLVGADLDLGPAVLGEDDLVALVQVHRDELPVLVPGAGTDCEDAAALRLLLRGVRKHDAARRRLLLFEDLDDEAVTKRLQVHADPPDLLSVTVPAGTLTLRVPRALYGWHSGSASANRRRLVEPRRGAGILRRRRARADDPRPDDAGRDPAERPGHRLGATEG